jgi:hypothetical protein
MRGKPFFKAAIAAERASPNHPVPPLRVAFTYPFPGVPLSPDENHELAKLFVSLSSRTDAKVGRETFHMAARFVLVSDHFSLVQFKVQR